MTQCKWSFKPSKPTIGWIRPRQNTRKWVTNCQCIKELYFVDSESKVWFPNIDKMKKPFRIASPARLLLRATTLHMSHLRWPSCHPDLGNKLQWISWALFQPANTS
jgi:hypothetical protein